MTDSELATVAELAARLVVEEGMEYAPAKRKAAQAWGRRQARSTALPSNEDVEAQVRDYLRLFCADTQPMELRALRELALSWMERLAEHKPHLTGAAWRGTATRLSNLIIDLYCEDIKATEIALINLQRGLEPRGGSEDDLTVLCTTARTSAWREPVSVFLVLRELDELRGALKPDASGRTWRGDCGALRRMLDTEEGA